MYPEQNNSTSRAQNEQEHFQLFPWWAELMLITLALITYTTPTQSNYSFSKLRGSFQASRPSNLWEWDCLMFNSSCRGMGMASSWQSPCTCACKKTGSSDKAFPQAAKAAATAGVRGWKRGWKGGGKGVGGKETLSSTWGLGIRQGRGCAGVNSHTYTG